MVKIAAGQELGLAPIQSMTGINVIKNRVTLSANLMAALLKKAGYRWRMVRFDDQVCEMLMFAPDGEELGPSSFSMQDAKKAQLSGGNWSKYPRNMLFARAISNAARWYAPEVITGCYTPEEMGDVEAIEATYTELPREASKRPRTMPSHRAEQTRDNHPTTMELDAPQTGQAPPTPPPGEAIPVRKLQTKFLFAACNKLGWGKHNLYDIAEIDSVTALTQNKIDALTKRLEGMDAATFQTDVSNVSVVQEYKTLLDQGASSDKFEDYWTRLPWSDLTVNVKCALSNMRFNFYRKRLEEAREDELFLCYWEDTPATYKRCNEFKKYAKQVNDLQEANAA